METVGDALPKEIQRCGELLKHYEDLGAPGRFGHMMITNDIIAAETAIAQGDIVNMIRSLAKLKDCQ